MNEVMCPRFNWIIGCAVWLVGACAVVPTPLLAETRRLESGARIRIKTPRVVKHWYGGREEGSPWVTGTLVQMELGFIHMRPEGATHTVTVPRDSVFRMEESLGRRARTKTGALLGGVVGAAIGVGIAAATDASGECSGSGFFRSCTTGEAEYGMRGFAIGAAVGYVVALMFPIEKWKRVSRWDRTFAVDLRAVPVGDHPQVRVVVSF